MFNIKKKLSSPKNTLLIGPLLHRIEGQSIAFDLVVNGFVSQGLPHRVVDIGSTDFSRSVGTFTLKRMLEILKSLATYWWYLLFSKRVYLLVGLSVFGFIRDFLIIISAHLFGRKIVLHVHSGGYNKFYEAQPHVIKKLIVKALLCADKIVILGDLLHKQFAFWPGLEEKLQVVSNSLPYDLSRDSFAIKTLGGKDPVRLLYLSNLIESKGYLDCLDACRILYIERGVDVHFDFCGRVVQHQLGSFKHSEQASMVQFKKRINQMGLSDVVTYHGVVMGYSKQCILNDSNIFILPTYYPWEGQPISIIEALAHGMPVISTQFRGIPEQVIDRYNGFLVEPHSATQIADCVESMCKDPERYRQMSINARKHFELNFTRKIHLDRLIPIILGDSIDK